MPLFSGQFKESLYRITLDKEAVSGFGKVVTSYQFTRRQIADDLILHKQSKTLKFFVATRIVTLRDVSAV